tara:strand:+ start:527 stop:1291 length:765 start_codon:yes stop_codon:yes gene_type:complete
MMRLRHRFAVGVALFVLVLAFRGVAHAQGELRVARAAAACTAAHLTTELVGHWNERAVPRTRPSRACAFQMRRYSCSYLGNETHAAQAEKQDYVLPVCELLRLTANVARFARVMNRRKLLLIGDSLTRQHFVELLCAISQNAPEGTRHDEPVWQNYTNPSVCGARHCSHTPGDLALLAKDHAYTFWLPSGERFTICHEYTMQDVDTVRRALSPRAHDSCGRSDSSSAPLTRSGPSARHRRCAAPPTSMLSHSKT